MTSPGRPPGSADPPAPQREEPWPADADVSGNGPGPQTASSVPPARAARLGRSDLGPWAADPSRADPSGVGLPGVSQPSEGPSRRLNGQARSDAGWPPSRSLPVPASPPEPASYDDDPTEILRRYVPAREVLDREARDVPSQPAVGPDRGSHPPRAVVRRRRTRRRLLEWPFLVAFALLAAFGIRTFVVQTFYIPSASMHETLLEGDRVLVNKVGYRLHGVRRGDVVVFRRPPNFPIHDPDLIKRVVALPGETVEARGRQVLIDGRPLLEPYVELRCQGTEDFAPIRVPPRHLWMMGDNRCDSSDSRVFGPIDEDLVVGRAFVLAWPPARLSWL